MSAAGSSEVRVAVPEGFDMRAFCGAGDANLRTIESLFDATVSLRSDSIVVSGATSELSVIASLVSELVFQVDHGAQPGTQEIKEAAQVLSTSDYSPDFLREDTLLTYRGRAIRPKTAGQKRYVDAIRSNSIVFCIGPAGTGKTYLAMAMAIAALKRREVGRIVLTRPVVEAGESLGFLPGSLTEKIDPYIRPLYDALFEMTDMEKGRSLIESGVVEIAPLAFMRGRTFNDAFLILDEAQNTTPEQMKMFLTRLGFGSKMVITGDATQLDLPHGVCGLKGVRAVLERIEGIAFVELDGADVVRHNLVAQIVAAYEQYGRGEQETLTLERS